MNKKRIRGAPFRTSGQTTAKSISVKGTVRRSDGRASKTAGFITGGLRRVPNSGLRRSRGLLTAAQESAEGVVGAAGNQKSSPKARTVGPERGHWWGK